MTIVAAGPIIAVRDLGRTHAFYRDVLSFAGGPPTDGDVFLTMRRDSAMVHFTQTDDQTVLSATANHMCMHIWLSDLDAFYQEISAALGTLPAGDVRPPFDQPYGQREFHVRDPDGFLIFFAEAATR